MPEEAVNSQVELDTPMQEAAPNPQDCLEQDAAEPDEVEADAAEQDAPEVDPLASSVLDDDAIDELVEEGHKETDAAHRKLAALEEELTLLCRRAIITTSERQWVRAEVELDVLMEQLNELRYEVALLPILESVCPAAADPSNKADMKQFCRWHLTPVREWRTSYRKGYPVYDHSAPAWLPRAEKEAIWNAYMLPNAVRDRIAQLGMRCRDAREMLSRFRGLARRNTKSRKP